MSRSTGFLCDFAQAAKLCQNDDLTITGEQASHSNPTEDGLGY